jgi:hypothetical protein
MSMEGTTGGAQALDLTEAFASFVFNVFLTDISSALATIERELRGRVSRVLARVLEERPGEHGVGSESDEDENSNSVFDAESEFWGGGSVALLVRLKIEDNQPEAGGGSSCALVIKSLDTD